ncbi:hypothetical protein HKX48_007159 [Thoreauomyces humboldtii]|nr:hypothetical protein HKX48_007159 [Thoreauomyces humboldtii]
MNAVDDGYNYHNITNARGHVASAETKDILMTGYGSPNRSMPGDPDFVPWLLVLSPHWVYFPYEADPGSTSARGGWGKGRYNASTDQAYAYLQSGAKQGVEYWSYSPIGSIIQGYAGVNLYANGEENPPSHLCQAGGSFESSLDPLLKQSVPSPNGVLFLIDSSVTDGGHHPGYIISTSVAGSSTDGLRPYNQTMSECDESLRPQSVLGLSPFFILAKVGIDTTSSVLVLAIGQVLRAESSTLHFPTLQTFTSTLLSSKWHIAVAPLAVSSTQMWSIVVAFPDDDYFTVINSSIHHSIVLIALLTALGLVVGIALALLVTWPLRLIARRMDEVTSMKFSALENGVLGQRSVIKEIATLEMAFQMMVQAL